MAVNNTGWGIKSDRRAVELPCTGEIVLATGQVFELQGFYFASCLVKFVRPGLWMVDPVIASGVIRGGGKIEIHYPEEPVLREGNLMVAQPIPNIVTRSYAELPGEAFVSSSGVKTRSLKRCKVIAGLPRAEGEPQGIFGLGYRQYIVEEVDIYGTVTF